MPNEGIKRDAVIGVSPSYKTIDIARSIDVARELYSENCSFELQMKDGGVSLIGPMVMVGENGEKEMLRPGVQIDSMCVDAASNIRSNKHLKRILNPELGDCVHVRRGQKNHSTLLQAVKTVLDGHGKMSDVIVRGCGASLGKAGTYAISISNDHARKDAPTHYVSSGQNVTDKMAQTLMQCTQHRRCVNVFYNGLYLGAFLVKETQIKKLKTSEVKEEHQKCKKLFAELHEKVPELFPSGMNEQMEHEISSMLGVSMWFILEPLDEHILDQWKHPADVVPWKTHKVTEANFQLPQVMVPKKNIKDIFGVGDDCLFGDIASLIERGGNMPFLKEEARRELFPDREDEDHEGDDDRYFSMKKAWTKEDFTHNHLMNAVLHGAAATAAKACGNCIQGVDVMTPPREMLEGVGDCSYQQLLDETNLKPVMVKPVHPPHLSQEPSCHLAVYVTNGFDPKLCLIDDEKKWKHRNGSSFMLSRDSTADAEDIVLKCIMCCVTTPTAVMHFIDYLHMDGNFPPAAEYITKFIKFVEDHEWVKSRILHTTFRKNWTTKLEFLQFLRNMSAEAGNTFRHAVKKNPDNREEIAKEVWSLLNCIDGITFQKFQVQVIMRAIEMCIHEPFGRPSVVDTSIGGEDGAKALMNNWAGEGVVHSKVSVEQIPQKIVDHFNHRVRTALSGDFNEVSKQQIQDELLVLCLTWSDELDCLVHTMGIGKRFDACDTEHMLCFFYTMLQNTFPHRNTSMNCQIDKDKYFPIRVAEIPLARERPIMKHFTDLYPEQILAYKRLLADKAYHHRTLHDIFRIDLERDNT